MIRYPAVYSTVNDRAHGSTMFIEMQDTAARRNEVESGVMVVQRTVLMLSAAECAGLGQPLSALLGSE